MSLRIDDFVNECAKLNSEMSVAYESVSPSIEFSNTGRRGLKHFCISVTALVQVFEDISDHMKYFENSKYYQEGVWRDLFNSYLTQSSTKALAGVQTKPFFTLLAKITHVANQLETPFSDDHFEISEANLHIVIDYLKRELPDDTMYRASGRAETNFSLNDLIHEENGAYPNLTSQERIKPENKIFYGAPGTGKSYAIDKLVNNSVAIRTVFHMDTQYADFVGSLKPHMISGKVVYSFRPGAFINAICTAYNSPNEHVYLVIEEINRAHAAAAFGEVFQLLDRDDTGASQYEIDISDPDLLVYLNDTAPSSALNGKLRIPSNLSLLATMNSSDQAVLPLDTAFKRRWKFEYTKIDYSAASIGELNIPINSGILTIDWADFARLVNQELKTHIPEDRLLGHRFISENELNGGNVEKVLTGKLFMYLWDDVLRHGLRQQLFDVSQVNSIGDLIDRFESGLPVFTAAFTDLLKEVDKSTPSGNIKNLDATVVDG